MLRWFRRGPSPHQTALAMVGAKAGEQLVIIGARDPDLIAELARVTGLNGQTVVVDVDPAAGAAVAAAAERAGTLAEFRQGAPSALPVPEASQDVVVLMVPMAPLDAPAREALAREAFRVLRDGGRLVVIEGGRRGGRMRPAAVPAASGDEVLALLKLIGARASRLLATVDATAYYEARK